VHSSRVRLELARGEVTRNQNSSGQDVKNEENMSHNARKINKLWEIFRNAVDAANADGQKANSADGHAEVNALHDYTRDNSWRLNNLLGRETANERRHRRNEISPRGFSVGTAAKLHIMNNAGHGSTLPAMPPAHLFLTMRQTAIEAEIIGFLARKYLSAVWRAELETLDYSTLMNEVE
jgi:hypothetical protein